MDAVDRTFDLASVAPRLARARDAAVVLMRRRRKLVRECDQLERLVVHRELQYYRSAMTHHPGYSRERWAKFREAQVAWEHARERLTDFDRLA